jgi:hypothetical protein
VNEADMLEDLKAREEAPAIAAPNPSAFLFPPILWLFEA